MSKRTETGIRPSVSQSADKRNQARAILAAVADCSELHMAYRINRALGLEPVQAAQGVIVKHCHPDCLPMGDPNDIGTHSKRQRLMKLATGLSALLEADFYAAVEQAQVTH